MDATTHALEVALSQLAPQTRAATDADAVAGVRPSVVVEPQDEQQVAAILRYASENGLAIIPRGGGSQLTVGTPPTRADIVLSMARIDQIIEHAPHDLTVTAQAGLRLMDLQQALGAAQQWLALDPLLDQRATLGGLIATNATGARRLRYGGVRDQIIGVRVALADGTIARGGGKVVKNVAGYDLPKLYTGSLGTLGVILSASFRLYPRSPFSSTVLLEANTLAALGAITQRILARPLTPTALTIFSPAIHGAPYTLAARFESGVSAAVDGQARSISAAPIADGAQPSAPLNGDDEARFWSDQTARWYAPAAPTADPDEVSATIKVSVPLTTVADWLTTLEAMNSSLTARWQAHAGHGVIFARLKAPPQTLARSVEALRSAANERRGSLIITDLPPALVGMIDPWGPIGALDVMRSLKQRFDPNNTLNPGRFVGGI